MRLLRALPLGLFLVVVWAGLRIVGFDLAMERPLAWALALTSMFVVMAEFYKSSDLQLRSFSRDLLAAVLALLVLVGCAPFIWASVGFAVTDGFIVAAVVFDAIVSPINSYRSALRNVQAGVNTAPVDSN